jgi:hypothetical protein
MCNGDVHGSWNRYRKSLDIDRYLSSARILSNANRGALTQCYTNLGKALALHDSADALKQYSQAAELLDI